MSEPFASRGTCSYQRQDVRPRRFHRRHQLLTTIWLTCSAFTWPGRVPHLSYNAAHGTVAERVQALRLLEAYPSQASSDACLAGLEDGASEVRAQAARCVAATADERAITNLLDLATSKDPEERAAALTALGRLAPPRALSSVEQALADPQASVRVAAARALQQYVRAGSFEPAKLTSLLHSELIDVRLTAIALLEELEPAETSAPAPRVQTSVSSPPGAARPTPAAGQAVPPKPAAPSRSPADSPRLAGLREAAADREAEVRAAAFRALGHARDVLALPALLAGVSDSDEAARLSAIAALGDSNVVGATNALLPLITSKALDIRAARTALAALGRIDDASALSALAPALTRAQLAEDAGRALTTRARRLRDAETHRLSVQALRRAIETVVAEHAQRSQAKRAAPSDGQSAASDDRSLAQSDATVIAALERGVLELAPYGNVQPAVTSLIAARTAGLQGTAPAAQLDALSAPRAPGTEQSNPPRADSPPPPRADSPNPVRVEALLRGLDDADLRVRERSSAVLGSAGDVSVLSALAERLERNAPNPELTLQACAGIMVREARAHALARTLLDRLLPQLQKHLTQPDETVAMSALYALRASRDPRAAHWIAALLRGSSTPLRAAAVQALADFDQTEARRMLRDMLRGDNVQNASNAALGLAEIGSDRDVEALLRAAERGNWPLPPSAAYAAARITQRGATRKHSLERVLCRFTQLRDSYVLTNSVAALAALGSDACDEQINPRTLLDPTLPSALRTAAATWLHNTRPHTQEEHAEHALWLTRCAGDHDANVAAACAPHAEQAEAPGQTLLRLAQSDGQTLLRNRTIALRLPDATVFIAQTDSAGQLLLPRAVNGTIQLEDPADQAAVILPGAQITDSKHSTGNPK